MGDCVLVFPFEGTLQKPFSPEVMSCALLFLPQHFLNDHLRADTGMITSRKIERREASHPVPANEQVLQSCTHGMTTVQSPCHVGWRYSDDERSSR